MELWEPVNGIFMVPAASLPPDLGSLMKALNSPLISAVIGGMLGASFGAWAAGWIAKRNKQYDAVTQEIRANNLAMLLAQQVFHLALALKVDAVKPMADAFNTAREKYIDPKPGDAIEAQNLQKISEVAPPIDMLRTCTLERITLPGIAIRAVLQIVESVGCLNRSLSKRNEFADLFMTQKFPPGMDFQHMYFGVEKNGACHTGYMDSMKSMVRYTDEVIFFSVTLCQMLDAHGVKLRKECKKLAWGKVTINRFRLDSKIPEGIIPDAKAYAKWFAGYEPQVESKKWWHLFRK